VALATEEMVMSIAATSSSMMRYMPIAPTQQSAQVARQAAPGSSVEGAPPPPPKGADSRQKLQDLLSQQVDAGAISQDQATLLSDFFAKVTAKGGPNGGGTGGDKGRGPKDDGPVGTKGPGAVGRRPPPPLADQTADTDASASSPLKDALDAFSKALKDNQTKATAYGAAAATPPTSTALFVDKLV
jgi:hypothetical protein